MRSYLFVPADSDRKLAKGLTSGADALILDLEDSVAAANKPAARDMAAAFLRDTAGKPNRPRLFVRINPLDSDLWQDDVATIAAAAPFGIVLPKPRSGTDVARLATRLDDAEMQAGLPPGQISILAIATEVPEALLAMHSFIGASDRLTGLTWGAEDLSAETGASATRHGDGRFTSPFKLARNLCLFAACAAKAQPIDTVFVNFRDPDGLRRESIEAARDGFTGKLAIHPDQVAIINDVYTPSPDAIARAREIVELFAANAGAGVISLRGKMVDRPHLVLAERTLARARLAGLA